MMLFSVILSLSVLALARAGGPDPEFLQLQTDRDVILRQLLSFIDRVRPTLDVMIDATSDLSDELSSKNFEAVQLSAANIRTQANQLGYTTTFQQLHDVKSNLFQLRARSSRRQREGAKDITLLTSFGEKLDNAYDIFFEHLSDPVSRCAFGHGESSTDGYYVFESRCYRFFDNKVDFDTARSTCQALGMDLVTLENQAQHDFLFDVFELEGVRESNGYYVYWLGGRRPSISHPFFWVVSGQALSSGYQNWDIGEPNNLPDETCLHTWRNDKWNDIPCTYEQKFVCQDYPSA